MTGAGTGPGALLAAIQASDIVWAVVAAGAVWLAGWGVILLLSRNGSPERSRSTMRASVGNGASAPAIPKLGVVGRLESEPDVPAPPSSPPRLPLPPHSTDDEAVDAAGVLRWLLTETEAEAAAFLRLAPGGGERLVVEPRGLEAAEVAALARAAREALVGEEPVARETAVARWLGAGGSKVIVLRGVAPGTASEALRFARFAIESRGGPAVEAAAIEARVRTVPGVAWAELSGDPPDMLRVLVAENVERSFVEDAVEHAVAGSELRLRWVEPAAVDPEPRARLVDVSMNTDGQSSAEVRIDWRGRELRGRAHGSATASGRFRAGANALADALRPLLAADVVVEGIYSYPHEDTSVMVVVVTFDGDRLVGAAPFRAAEPELCAARAVLDAMNRRLAQVAGGSGRI